MPLPELDNLNDIPGWIVRYAIPIAAVLAVLAYLVGRFR